MLSVRVQAIVYGLLLLPALAVSTFPHFANTNYNCNSPPTRCIHHLETTSPEGVEDLVWFSSVDQREDVWPQNRQKICFFSFFLLFVPCVQQRRIQGGLLGLITPPPDEKSQNIKLVLKQESTTSLIKCPIQISITCPCYTLCIIVN